MSTKGDLSRREVLAAGGAFLASAAVGATPLRKVFATRKSQVLASGGRMVLLTRSSDPNFATQLDSLFPGLAQDSIFQTISPVAVLVTNSSGIAIKAISLEWSITSASTVSRQSYFFYLRPGTKALLSGQRAIIENGKTRLISPFFSWNPKRFRSGGSPRWGKILNGSKARKSLVQQLQGAPVIDVKVSAAVYGDHVVIGPERANLAKHFRIRRNAEHDEALSLLKTVNPSSVSRPEMASALRHHKHIRAIAGSKVPKADVKRHLYYHSRKIQAKRLHNLFRKTGKRKFVARLIVVKHKKRTKLKLATS